jgi:hypothetical protein
MKTVSFRAGTAVMRRLNKPDVPFMAVFIRDRAIAQNESKRSKFMEAASKVVGGEQDVEVVLSCKIENYVYMVGDDAICDYLRRGACGKVDMFLYSVELPD